MPFNTSLEKVALLKSESELNNELFKEYNFQLGFKEGHISGYQKGLKDAVDEMNIDDAIFILKNSKKYKILETNTLEDLHKFEFMSMLFKKYSLTQIEEIFSAK